MNTDKKKIAILSDFHPDEVLGGGGIIAHEFFRLLSTENVESQFWCTYAELVNINTNDPSIRLLKSIPSRFRALGYLNEIIGLWNVFRLVQFIFAFKPNTIWVNQIGNRFSFVCIPIFKLLKIKVVITLHDYLVISKYKIAPGEKTVENLDQGSLADPLSLISKIRHTILCFYINFADEIICVSLIQSEILKSFGVKVTQIINNGIAECNHFDQSEILSSDKDLLSLGKGEQNIVLFAGRMNGKGLDILTTAIQESDSEWLLVLAGEIDLAQYCQANLRSEQFIYLGRLQRKELLRLIHEVDLVAVLSQYYDPYPTIALEAVKHGTAFFTTEVSGVTSLLNREESRFLISRIGDIPNLSKIFLESQQKKYILQEISQSILSPKKVLKYQYLPFL